MSRTSYKINKLNEKVLFSENNYTNIEKDFWIYRFEINPKEVGYEYSLIDDLKQELKSVKSVVYLVGKTFFALFDKKDYEDQFSLENDIKKLIQDSNEVNFYIIDNVRNHDERNANGISKRSLAQLFFNTLANSDDDRKKRMSNITGGLYWILTSPLLDGKKENPIVWQYNTIKVELDYHLHLKLEVNTFSNVKLLSKKNINFDNRKKKLKDYVRYSINEETLTMNRLKGNTTFSDRNDIFIKIQKDGTKATVPFLNFEEKRNRQSAYDSFLQSKMGILYEFISNNNGYLGKYLSLEFEELPFSNEKKVFDKINSQSVENKILNFHREKKQLFSV